MATKTVDVFIGNELVETYELDCDICRAPLFDQDFIDRARECPRADD